MAANRKLQSAVEAALKKIEEGLVDFGSAYKKAEEAANANQREKTQSELKREIKKLQRLRDDVMKWLTEGDIKDKQPLIEARKRIEAEMERYKTFEREAKTKPFSFQGLAMSEKADPELIRRLALREKAEALVSDLKIKMEELEADIEAILGKKKKPTGSDAAKLDELKLFLTRHSFHVLNLELLLRKIDNECVIDFEEAECVLDQVGMFITDFESPDYFHDDALYEGLALNDLSVDASYFQPSMGVEEGEVSEGDSQGKKESAGQTAKTEIKVPLSAMAKAKAFKKAFDQDGGASSDVAPPAPAYPPPAPPRPTMPTTPPPVFQPLNAMPTRKCPQPPPTPSSSSFVAPPVAVAPTHPAPPKPPVGPTSVWVNRAEAAPTPSPPAPAPLLPSMVRPEVEDTILRHRPYIAMQPARLPDYPASVLGGACCEEALARRLSEEALLLVFYYREGSFLQLVIARELRRRGFKWHRKLRQWFKRVEDPKMTTVDYEHGSYFTLDPRDPEWRLKVKHDVTLEYQFTAVPENEVALD